MRLAKLVKALLAAGALITGCARVGAPGGGPADTTPPEVLATEPADGATWVPLDSVIRIAFSEEMNRVATERAFSLEPPVKLKNLKWDGLALVAKPESALPESTTFVVRIDEGADDYHGVKLEGRVSVTFSTGPSLDTGAISGIVTRDGDPVPGATVWACRGPVMTTDGVVRRCRYSATTDRDGTFSIAGVAASETPYLVLAFIDFNEDDVYSVDEEAGVIADVRASIAEPGTVAEGITLELEDSSEVEGP